MTATLTKVTAPSSAGPPSGGAALPARRVSADLERSLTEAARAMLRLGVPQSALPEGVSIDRAGYWLLVRASERAPVRLSDLAECVELDLSTVSRQMRDMFASGPMVALTHRQILIVFSGLMLGMFLAALDQTIVGTALPTIVNSLHGLNHIR